MERLSGTALACGFCALCSLHALSRGEQLLAHSQSWGMRLGVILVDVLCRVKLSTMNVAVALVEHWVSWLVDDPIT